MIYEKGKLVRILTSEGYITLAGNTPTYHYYLRDHQGNNRVVIQADGTVEQVNHYYPYGGLFGESTSGDRQPYKYGGKEFDRMHGLDWYDFMARMKDDWSFTAIDPLCEKYYSISPYVYCFDNPIRYVDLDGRQPRPTRPPIRRGYKNGGRPNPYASYPQGVRPQSYIRKTSVSYTSTGLRQTISAASPDYIKTVETAGGNKVQMTNDNLLGNAATITTELLSAKYEFEKNLFDLVKNVTYAEDRVITNIDIEITDPELKMKQLEYEKEAGRINQELEDADDSDSKYFLMKIMERSTAIRKKLGLSPKDIIEMELIQHPESFKITNDRKIVKPEIRQGGN